MEKKDVPSQVILEEMTLDQLKALAYDQVVQINQAQNNLRLIEAEIRRRNKDSR